MSYYVEENAPSSLNCNDGKLTKEVQRRLAFAGNKFGKFNKIWRQIHPNIQVRMQLFICQCDSNTTLCLRNTKSHGR